MIEQFYALFSSSSLARASLFGSRLSMLVAVSAVVMFVITFSPAQSEEQFPWGDSRNPQTVTPEENPIPPYENDRSYGDDRRPSRIDPRSQNRTRYDREPNYDGPDYDRDYDGRRQYGREGPLRPHNDRYSDGEIMEAGHRFFGTVSSGLAKIIEYSFSQSGRPNGYILGEDAGGAFIAGLRYGEGILYTKDAGQHRVYWQGPSIGYDFGAEGSKTMILVYNLYSPNDIYRTFSGVSGSAYFIGGVGITFQKQGNVSLAPIRAGIGARLGANIGYLKYTRRPTWNPF